MTLIADLTAALGAAHVITGADLARYTADVTHHYHAEPIAAVRPADTAEVAQVMQIAARHGVAVVPASGRTGLTGGLMTVGGLILSVERLNTIRQINPGARLAIVEAGVVLDSLHKAAEAEDLYFPLWFGARGSAMIGGVLSTNAGGSNVLRYGSTRALCLGLEVVLADGRILNLMSALHKDNSGYDLKQLFIGAEGTLGVITAAVMKLVPRPRAYATATLSARSLPDALILLNRLQAASGGAVEAFEYMPASYMAQMARARPDIRQPFSPAAEVTILVELGSLRPDDTTPKADGSLQLTGLLETTLAQMMAEGMVQDAEIAQTEAQRAAMWQRRELASEVMTSRQPTIDTDICLPTDLVAPFLDRISTRLPQLDAAAETILVAHLGDGNVHFTVYPSDASAAHADRIIEAVEDEVQALGGSFSAEHGVGLSKLASMKRRKDPVALDVMRAIKTALDPDNRMNPGKVIPAP
ncbi:FAD-binding oxidoreductase [Cypionkella sp.]|uniref:FAD-binding oxidoreductase n=1 Tax=Cypionkella sp. TaxID=2811411 RepID=UPI0037530CC0